MYFPRCLGIDFRVERAERAERLSTEGIENAGSKIGLAGMPTKFRSPITVERIFATWSLSANFPGANKHIISPDRESRG